MLLNQKFELNQAITNFQYLQYQDFHDNRFLINILKI